LSELRLIATATFGLEAVVARELRDLGYEDARAEQNGRVFFTGDETAICRANLWLRSSDRVLICLGQFEARDFGELFDQTNALPWEQWIPNDGKAPVSGKSIRSQLSSVPACQKIVKKAIVERLKSVYKVDWLEETGPTLPVEVALLKDQVTLSIDTTGPGLHKRGYRKLSAVAPLKETLAAAMVLLSFWNPDRPLIDPFCGSGTIPIEAAMIGRRMAPGMNRSFIAQDWPNISGMAWADALAEARDVMLPDLPARIIGTDVDGGVLSLARYHAGQAGVEPDIHFQQRDFADLRAKRDYGCIITNPPYGTRLGEMAELRELYETFPDVLRGLPTWSHYVLTAYPDFEDVVGQQADRRRKLYNGRIECTYFQFHGPHPKEESEQPAFGGVPENASRQAEEFRNRLAKNAKHLRRYPTKQGITCYRIYERDIPEIPLIVDRYEDHLHVSEYERPNEHTAAQHADWLDLMTRTAGEALEVERDQVFAKFRRKQRGLTQHERVDDERHQLIVQEGGLKFEVNLSDYVDTGLFLDHRITRGMVRDQANGKKMLNLFAYTGSFSVYAAAGGASRTVSVDLSNTYLQWAHRNFELNGLLAAQHHFVQQDSMSFLNGCDDRFDLAVVDPPTFSNSKRTEEDWDVKRDHAALLNALLPVMNPGGVIYFSTNFRRFKLDEAALEGVDVREISKQTVPPEYRNKRVHRCWRLTLPG